jgi:nucleoside 2-deoxyribosyltransferase
MIIYCAGAIRGDTTFQNNFLEIINFLESQGHTVLAELNGKYNSSIPLTDKQIYTRDIKWIEGSQMMVAEISGPSLGVGFEIAYALFQKKIPVLAVVTKEAKKLSAMIAGCSSELLTVKEYNTVEELHSIINYYFESSNKKSEHKGVRFTVHK